MIFAIALSIWARSLPMMRPTATSGSSSALSRVVGPPRQLARSHFVVQAPGDAHEAGQAAAATFGG
nr:hypothetical protein [Thermoleophilaceae bacterium]